jgi:hypothetical protein
VSVTMKDEGRMALAPYAIRPSRSFGQQGFSSILD